MRMYPSGRRPRCLRNEEGDGRFVAVYPTLQLAAGAGALG